MLLSQLFSVTSVGPATRRRLTARGYGRAVQRTAFEIQYCDGDSAPRVPMAGTRGGVYGRAVATPVLPGFARQKPPALLSSRQGSLPPSTC